MGKNQFLNKHQFLGISKEELERKWRVQELMEREKYMPSVYWPATANTFTLLDDEPECSEAEFTEEFNFEFNTCLDPEDDVFLQVNIQTNF